MVAQLCVACLGPNGAQGKTIWPSVRNILHWKHTLPFHVLHNSFVPDTLSPQKQLEEKQDNNTH